MKNSVIFQNALKQVPEDVKIQVDLSMGIADRIVAVLNAKNMTQKEFAKLMGKTEAEVSRWVGGTHNFTLSTLAKISAALGTSLIYISTDYILTEDHTAFAAEDISSNTQQ